jgi:hypothetical protein
MYVYQEGIDGPRSGVCVVAEEVEAILEHTKMPHLKAALTPSLEFQKDECVSVRVERKTAQNPHLSSSRLARTIGTCGLRLTTELAEDDSVFIGYECAGTCLRNEADGEVTEDVVFGALPFLTHAINTP